jgi:hypothetical protein
VVAVVAGAAMLAWMTPRPVVVADTARRVAGAELAATGGAIRAFRAGYDRWNAVMVAAAGRTFQTHQVRLRFPNGVQRDYWIAAEPPSKIRMVASQNGRLVTSGWDLRTLEVLD